MFISRRPICFRKCLAYQQGMLMGSKLIIESTMQYHQIRYGKPELLSRVNDTIALDCGKSNLHTSCIQHGSKNLMKKFANKSKKRLWYETSTFGPKQMSPSSQIGLLQPTKPKKENREISLRTKIINSILFKAISDFINSHEVSAEVYSLNVEISKVSLPPDFSNCRVYWKTSGTPERDSLIQQVLDKSAPRLRHLLISHQILGSVPPVVFLRDKQYAALVQVEHLLQNADFGQEENTGETKNTDNETGGREPAQLADTSEQPAIAKRGPLFGIDHEALNKQILEYKQQSGDSLCEIPVPSLTQQQLDMLAKLRRQKLIEKKKKHSRRNFDDDITPKDYLLARYSQGTSTEEAEDLEYDKEESQMKELMEQEDRRS
ncbi:hypothetical protein AAFF_G00403430 [Aldrovandia affinis]|uniref:Ribosome-binding factor A, mitochondrial n=1 Tax=Aldrovandia affinis TaxID=143900 RepID=A0AAD7T7C1_9TELE|nr:hypothetical protein AAFF_G00403430 [Aldrovandia affinis]